MGIGGLIARTTAVAVVLHGAFTVGVPWLILRKTSDWPELPIGELRHAGWVLVGIGATI